MSPCRKSNPAENWYREAPTAASGTGASLNQGISIELKPDGAIAYNNRAWNYHLAGEDSEELPDANRAVALAPRYAGVIETRAEIYEKLGQRDKAIADYRQSLTLNPDMISAQNGLTRLGAY